jgi:hypothetical protein
MGEFRELLIDWLADDLRVKDAVDGRSRRLRDDGDRLLEVAGESQEQVVFGDAGRRSELEARSMGWFQFFVGPEISFNLAAPLEGGDSVPMVVSEAVES